MKYPYCCALAAIVYNSSFNATAKGPCSASMFAEQVDKLDESVVKAAEAKLNENPELFGPYVEKSESLDVVAEKFVAEFCDLLGIT